jgi:hypothetical protein
MKCKLCGDTTHNSSDCPQAESKLREARMQTILYCAKNGDPWEEMYAEPMAQPGITPDETKKLLAEWEADRQGTPGRVIAQAITLANVPVHL